MQTCALVTGNMHIYWNKDLYTCCCSYLYRWKQLLCCTQICYFINMSKGVFLVIVILNVNNVYVRQALPVSRFYHVNRRFVK